MLYKAQNLGEVLNTRGVSELQIDRTNILSIIHFVIKIYLNTLCLSKHLK